MTETENNSLQVVSRVSGELLLRIMFTGISFIFFLVLPIWMIVAITTADTVPLWFFFVQLAIFLIMSEEGLPIVWNEVVTRLKS